MLSRTYSGSERSSGDRVGAGVAGGMSGSCVRINSVASRLLRCCASASASHDLKREIPGTALGSCMSLLSTHTNLNAELAAPCKLLTVTDLSWTGCSLC